MASLITKLPGLWKGRVSLQIKLTISQKVEPVEPRALLISKELYDEYDTSNLLSKLFFIKHNKR
jgi:hypothetical protein